MTGCLARVLALAMFIVGVTRLVQRDVPWAVGFFVLAVLLAFAGKSKRRRGSRDASLEAYAQEPTMKQLEYASRLGIPVPNDISRGELSELIEAWNARSKRR